MGNWDYGAIVAELQTLAGARFDKYYICTDASNLLKLRKNGAINIVGDATRLYSAEKAPETLEKPPQFSMVVRKWLDNSILKNVQQINGDRIVSFEFDAKEGTFFLIFELFAKGNTLLLNSEKKIVDVLKREEYADRKLKQREPYVTPPAKKLINDLKIEEIKPLGKTVAAISSVVNVPPFYIEEAVARLRCSTNIAELSESDKTHLLKELKQIKTEYSPAIYFEKEASEKPIAFSFTKLTRFKEKEVKEFPTFSLALEYYFQNADRIEVKKEPKPSKISNRLEHQRKAIEEFKKLEKENSEKAEWINSKYELIDELLQTAKPMMKTKSETEIEQTLLSVAKKHGEKIELKIKSGKIEVEILDD